jgi:hypothetical protein
MEENEGLNQEKPKKRKMRRKYERKVPAVKTRKTTKKPKPNYNFTERASSYLKYFRLVRRYVQKKYELSMVELEMILYLYDENIFDKPTFVWYSRTIGFTSFNWFDQFKDRGIIEKWRDEHGLKKYYKLASKYKHACYTLYKHLEGEPIPTRVNQNPLFKSTASTNDKVYARLIKRMNEERAKKNGGE